MNENHPVMKNAEEFYFAGNDVGVLISHGFTGTTQSMFDVGKRIAEEGYTVLGPRLTGHGTHPEDMERATYKNWIADVEAGLEKVKESCSTIFVVGLSMGGTLALYLAENHPEITGIVPINAATSMPELGKNFNDLQAVDIRFVDGIGSDIKMEGVEELAYPQTPVKAMGEILSLMEIVRGNLKNITAPALIFSSIVDHVVPPENSTEIYNGISSEQKSFVQMENSYHVATLDNDKELIAEKCIQFIREQVKCVST
ncbi:alpha/beta hydrolase [Virgibacillus byunsanensis]|uniref:Alpha/beta hydrolase n=1 Tax=Virgibacillus byunsanensis TaxID=570945 RepID=A0ABW3LSK5_9BACI